jgi:hypothetical protein
MDLTYIEAYDGSSVLMKSESNTETDDLPSVTVKYESNTCTDDLPSVCVKTNPDIRADRESSGCVKSETSILTDSKFSVIANSESSLQVGNRSSMCVKSELKHDSDMSSTELLSSGSYSVGVNIQHNEDTHSWLQHGDHDARGSNCKICIPKYNPHNNEEQTCSSLRAHRLEDNSCNTSSSDKPCKCDICRKSCLLVNAVRVHTGDKPYKCDTCGKTFSRKCHLVGHMKVHTNDKPAQYMYIPYSQLAPSCTNAQSLCAVTVRIITSTSCALQLF